MAALPYIQLYVADYLADTMHLTTEEHGAYLLLIMNYWQTGKAIPEKRIQAVARLSNERLTDVKNVLSEFFTIDEQGFWHHDRIDKDLERVQEKSLKASAAGKASAKKRAELNKNSTDVERSLNGRSNSVEPKLNHKDTDKDTDKEKEGTKKQRQKSPVFKPPSEQELMEFARANNLNLSGMHDYYESNGWMVGKNKMKNWQAAARRWHSNPSKYSKQNQSEQPDRSYSPAMRRVI